LGLAVGGKNIRKLLGAAQASIAIIDVVLIVPPEFKVDALFRANGFNSFLVIDLLF
jgi:hypothetical protein